MKRWVVGAMIGLLCAVTAHGREPAHAAVGSAPAPAHTSFDIASAVLGERRHMNVYTPPGYAVDRAERYPVLYMLDGGLQEDFPHVAADVDSAIRAGRMRPMIVVGIENTERRRDTTGPTVVDSDKAIAAHVGGSAAFRRFIASELMPAVRQRYRCDGRTAIIGESLAGLFVLETFFEKPTLFDTYVALSPSLWWNDQALVRHAAARLQAWPGLNKTLYVATAGDDGNEKAMAVLQTALRSSAPTGLTWFYQPQPTLHHSDIYRRGSPAVFRQLFPPPATTKPGSGAVANPTTPEEQP